ncbi:hypothetical protein ACH42_16520 [Endozoicomonas sp. (ex Bugula neritina AB1)]|nr:hypothetical protein ACH42_16520 [Endozoicomonas sp. (ex Bugula neritina AB1)]
MGLDNINDRPVQPDPFIDRETAPSVEDKVEQETQITFENARSYMEDMLEMNYGVIHELLGQIAAISPFRLDMVQGKQPDVAASDASNDVQTTPIAPVGKASASAYIAGLQHVSNILANHDMKLQQVFDRLELSRSGRKPDLFNHGVEYEKLMTMVRQSETRLYQLASHMPETLPDNTGLSLKELMPEFSEDLYHYDSSFQYTLAVVLEEIRQAKQSSTAT